MANIEQINYKFGGCYKGEKQIFITLFVSPQQCFEVIIYKDQAETSAYCRTPNNFNNENLNFLSSNYSKKKL